MDTNTKIYAILNIADLDSVNFNEVITTSKETTRKNVAETEFVIKYFVTPTFISDGTVTPVSVLDHEACLALMETDAWTDPNQPGE
tara:strand:- start:383 stop:640 length:258 start_codon:yes stop_codon:yes gene_type:complete